MQEIDQILDDCCTNMSNMVLQIDYTSLTNPTLRRSEELQGYKFPHYAAESLVARAPRLDPDGEFLKVFLQMYGNICEQRSIMIPKTQLVQGLAHCLYVLLIQTDEWRATVRTKWSPPFQLQYNSIKSLLMVEHQTASILNWLETQVTFGPNAWMDYCGIALYFVALWSYQEHILGRAAWFG